MLCLIIMLQFVHPRQVLKHPAFRFVCLLWLSVSLNLLRMVFCIYFIHSLSGHSKQGILLKKFKPHTMCSHFGVPNAQIQWKEKINFFLREVAKCPHLFA